MSQPPPGAKVSKDGRSFWDGQHWVSLDRRSYWDKAAMRWLPFPAAAPVAAASIPTPAPTMPSSTAIKGLSPIKGQDGRWWTADGKQYWDGQKWNSMLDPISTRPRGRGWGGGVVIVSILAGIVLVLAGVGVFLLDNLHLANQVLPQRTLAVSVTDDNGNALSGVAVTLQGSSISAATETTGVAQLSVGSLGAGIYTVVAIDTGYINSGVQVSISASGDLPPVSIRMPWAPPLGTFVWQSKSTLWNVLIISGGNPDYAVEGYQIEWHCFGGDWSKSNVTVTLGRDQLTYAGSDVPMGPGAISKSFVLDGSLPDTSRQAPAGTCLNGQNAW